VFYRGWRLPARCLYARYGMLRPEHWRNSNRGSVERQRAHCSRVMRSPTDSLIAAAALLVNALREHMNARCFRLSYSRITRRNIWPESVHRDQFSARRALGETCPRRKIVVRSARTVPTHIACCLFLIAISLKVLNRYRFYSKTDRYSSPRPLTRRTYVVESGTQSQSIGATISGK